MLFGTWPTSPRKFRARHHFFELSSISISSPRRTVSSLLFCPLRSILTAHILRRERHQRCTSRLYHLLGSHTFSVDGPSMFVLHMGIVIVEDAILRRTLDRGGIEMASRCCRRRLSNVGCIVMCCQSIICIDWIRLLKRMKDVRLIDRSIESIEHTLVVVVVVVVQPAGCRSSYWVNGCVVITRSLVRTACNGTGFGCSWDVSWNQTARPSKNTGR